MKKNYLIIILIVLIASGVYLNRAYSHIYSTLNGAGLVSPDQQGQYTINEYGGNAMVYTALGDSLTAGVGTTDYFSAYPYLIAQQLADHKKVVLNDLAVPGYKIADVYAKLVPQAISQKPSIITLLIGVNDIHGLTAPMDFKNYYIKTLEQLTTQTNAEIYVINIPYLGSEQLLLFPYNFYFDRQTKTFNQMIKQLANQYGVYYIDLYTPTLLAAKNNSAYYAVDGFHPSAYGYQLWATIIYDSFNK